MRAQPEKKMDHEANKRLHINNEIQVYAGFAKDIGGNGLRGDASMYCMIAPEVDGDDEWVYLSTAGGSVVVGWIDPDGDLELADEARQWINSDDMRWLQAILMDVFAVKFFVAEEPV